MKTEPSTLQTPIEILQAALKREKAAYHAGNTMVITAANHINLGLIEDV